MKKLLVASFATLALSLPLAANTSMSGSDESLGTGSMDSSQMGSDNSISEEPGTGMGSSSDVQMEEETDMSDTGTGTTSEDQFGDDVGTETDSDIKSQERMEDKPHSGTGTTDDLGTGAGTMESESIDSDAVDSDSSL